MQDKIKKNGKWFHLTECKLCGTKFYRRYDSKKDDCGCGKKLKQSDIPKESWYTLLEANIEVCPNMGYRSKVKCRCGEEYIVNNADIKNIKRNSKCKKCSINERTIYKSEDEKRIMNIFRGMKHRCYTNDGSDRYMHYGGRGILICSEWLEDPTKFIEWALKNGYAKNLTIERVDVNKGYSPDNCTWANVQEQNQNQRTTILTKELVIQIRELYGKGHTPTSIKTILNISSIDAIKSVLYHNTWSNVSEEG